MSPIKPSTKDKKQSVTDFLRQKKKEQKKKLREKRARLVVTNLAFNATEEDLKQHFGKYGDVLDIHVLKKEDGKLRGCAFIQYKLVQKARKAKHYTDGKPFMGRNINVDFAMSKKEYDVIRNKKQVKVENDTNVEVKEEPIDDYETPKPDVKKEEDSRKTDNDQNESDEDEEQSDESENAGISDEELDDDEDDVKEVKEEEHSEHNKPRVFSNDVSEGKTVFIKNIPFTATNDDLKACMEKYGPIHYALICVDKYTEHSKGTAFVKFCSMEDAQKVLDAGTELTLLGNILDCHKALGRNEIQAHQESKSNKKSEVKDSRNLYLVKEGVILAGSKAAEGVSQADMMKRIQLEKYKSEMLRNLNMFVSRERIVIHNLPLTWDDKKLRELCKKFAGEGARIKEARVMRNLRDLDSDGVGKSKGFGFVTLESHESALTLLRNLNNNPNIFSAAKRPIITFSIERKSAIKAKSKRLEKSRMKNPLSKQYNPELVKKDENKHKEHKDSNVDENLKSFSGITGKPGVQKMRSNYKLSQQAAKHLERVKNEKKKKKTEKKSLEERRKEFTKQNRQKIKRKPETDEFSKMESEYKKAKIDAAPKSKKKWYS